MAKTDLKNFIIPTTLENTDEDQQTGNRRFNTTDLVFIDSSDEVVRYDSFPSDRKLSLTDYAVANGAFQNHSKSSTYGKRGSACSWLRSAYSEYGAMCVARDGGVGSGYVEYDGFSLAPALHLNLTSVISARSASQGAFKVSEVKVDGRVHYHTIEFGEYPKSKASNDIQMSLSRLFDMGRVRPTGKKYTGYIAAGEVYYNEEYEYNGQKYVRVKVNAYESGKFYADGSDVEDESYVWFKVEPITWKIRNWDELPKTINPSGTGRAKFIDIKTDEIITGSIPFYPNDRDENISFWQNSTVRGYLNGISVNNIRTNGNTKFTAPNGGDFSLGQSFITEALEVSRVAEVIETKTPKRTRKGYGVVVQTAPMTVAEQIKFYIDSGKSFMLHGPSGVGKTRRIEEADPDFVSIVLRNGILPEEVIGKTIYPNNDKTTGGTWVPPAWYVSLCEQCEREPDKKHVLFIDEITNVKPSEQSLVFHLVLNNSIGPNIGKLPNNVVVVAAGNSKDESEAAYNMPEPLFRRFDGHIELKPDVQMWLEWASEPSKKGVGRLKVHPLVSAFVGTYGAQVFYSPYDSEEPPKYAIDPRGWEQISDIIYDNGGVIARELIENKVGKEIASTFIAFAQTPPIMLEDVLENNYDAIDIPTQFDAKYALALSLRSANEEQIVKVRKFVARELGAEILAMFDTVWVGNNDERAILMANLIATTKTTSDDGRNS